MTPPLSFDVPRTSVRRISSSFPYALTFPEPRIARLVQKPGIWFASGIFILIGLGTVVFAVLPLLGVPPGGGGLITAVGVGSLFVYARGEMTFDRYRGVLRMKRRRRDIGPEVPLRDIAAVQLLGVKGGYGLEMNLVFAQPRGERLCVMCHTDEAALRTDAERLAEFLSVPLLDDRGEPIAIDGQTMKVDVRMVRTPTANFRTRKLCPDGVERMILKATRGARSFQLLFVGAGSVALIAGIGMLIAGVPSDPDAGAWVRILGPGIPLLVGSVFLLVSLTLLATPPIVFDRVAGVVRGKSLRIDKRRVEEIPLGDVAAVQICSGDFPGASDAGSDSSQV